MTYQNRATEDPVSSYHHGAEALTSQEKEKPPSGWGFWIHFILSPSMVALSGQPSEAAIRSIVCSLIWRPATDLFPIS